MTSAIPEALVFSIFPNSRGFGFVLFEGPYAPYDWGVKEVREPKKNRRILKFVEDMIDRYSPIVLVLEDWTDEACHRCVRIRELYRQLVELARRKCIVVFRYSWQRVKHCFAEVVPTTKYEIALRIAKEIPAFSFQVPPVRKIWMSEDPRQGLYDAAALGLTHFATTEGSFSVREDRLPEEQWG